jgi:hypothetical protein
MESQSVTKWYLDKSLYLTVLGILLPLISKWIGFELDTEKVAAILIPVVAYVVAHKVKSGAVLIAEIKAKAKDSVAKEPAYVPPGTPEKAADALASLNR